MSDQQDNSPGYRIGSKGLQSGDSALESARLDPHRAEAGSAKDQDRSHERRDRMVKYRVTFGNANGPFLIRHAKAYTLHQAILVLAGSALPPDSDTVTIVRTEEPA